MWNELHLLCIIFFVFPAPVSLLKLNTPRILLPHSSGIPINVSLELFDFKSDDCFEWYSSSPEVVQVTPVYANTEACSRSANVTVASQSAMRKEAFISISHLGTTLLFCDVVVDKIDRLELHYTTTKLFLHGPPETIFVSAKNAEGSIFSTLNGLEFIWSIENLRSSSKSLENKNILRFVDYHHSLYYLENIVTSSVVLVEGESIGSALIKVEVKQPIYSDVHAAEVTLTVSSCDVIYPVGDIYVMLGANVNFQAKTRYGQFKDASSYTTYVQNTTVATLDDKGILFTWNYGETIFTAIDAYGETFSTTVHVVEPDSITIDLPEKSWNLFEGKSYEISVNLWDSNNNQIYPSNNIKVRTRFPSQLFYINASTPNGTHHSVRALIPGSSEIKAEFMGVQRNGEIVEALKLSASQKFVIYQTVQLSPPVLLLPFYLYSSAMYIIPFKVTGGTGFYSWMTSNTTVTKIGNETKAGNYASVQFYGKGEFLITAKDKNSTFSATSRVCIQHVVDIEVYPTVIESEIGNDIILPVGLLGFACEEKKTYKVFDDCSKINISVEIIEKHILSYKPGTYIPPFGRGCKSLEFLCLQPGHTRINLSYETEKSVLRTTVVAACHKPVKPVHPVRVAVLALGTSKEVSFEGGPRPWPMFNSGHYLKLTADEPKYVNISIIKDPVRYNRDLHIFNVKCKALGETFLVFSVGNQASPTNPNPAQLESSVKIVCNKPHSLHIAYKATKQGHQATSVVDKPVVKVPFYGHKQFEIDLWVKDEIGRKFANISSFSIHWKVSDEEIAMPLQSTDCIVHVDGSASYRKVSRIFQKFQMSGKTGSLMITAEMVGYKEDLLANESILIYDNLQKISKILELKLVSLRDMYDEVYNNEEQQDGQCHGVTCNS